MVAGATAACLSGCVSGLAFDVFLDLVSQCGRQQVGKLERVAARANDGEWFRLTQKAHADLKKGLKDGSLGAALRNVIGPKQDSLATEHSLEQLAIAQAPEDDASFFSPRSSENETSERDSLEQIANAQVPSQEQVCQSSKDESLELMPKLLERRSRWSWPLWPPSKEEALSQIEECKQRLAQIDAMNKEIVRCALGTPQNLVNEQAAHIDSLNKQLAALKEKLEDKLRVEEELGNIPHGIVERSRKQFEFPDPSVQEGGERRTRRVSAPGMLTSTPEMHKTEQLPSHKDDPKPNQYVWILSPRTLGGA